MGRRITAVLLLITAHAALAQVTGGSSFTVRETNDQDQFINIAECQGTAVDGLVFSWTIPNFSVQGTFTLIASNQSGCPIGTGTTATNTTIADGLSATSASGAFPVATTVGVPSLLSGLSISCTGAATAVYFCVNYNPSSGAQVANAVTGTLQLDLARPSPPVITSVTPGDSALNVSWTTASTQTNASGAIIGQANSYQITVTAHADATDTRTSTVTNATSTRITGLQNGTPYDVTVVGLSPGGNLSDPSATATGTPVMVLDFWRLYQADGGREKGGCATGAGGLLALLALVPFALGRRRRR